jgi:hypothetical protein
LFTTVYLKLDGRWQMIAHQVSNVGEKWCLLTGSQE